MKRILFISTLTPPYYGSSMSSEMCLDILKKDNKYDVINIKLNYSLIMSDVGKVNLKKIYGFFQVWKQIRSSLKQYRPDIIYFVPAVCGLGLIRDFFFLRTIKKLKKGKLILHLRGQFKKEDWNNPIKNFIIKNLLVCDKAIVLGPELIANLNQRVLVENIHILPNAIPNTLSDSEFDKIIKERNSNSHLNLLFLSNMQEAKGWFKVLEASKLLFDSGINFSCHFVGEWSSKKDPKRFQEYIEKNNLINNIIYHGQLLNEEKNKMFVKSNILIYPTSNDACPRVIIEAMEYGLTIISSKEGTIPSLILNDETGLILKKNTADEIFKNVLKLIDNNFRREMEIKGRQRFLEKFTLDTYKNRFIEIFNDT